MTWELPDFSDWKFDAPGRVHLIWLPIAIIFVLVVLEIRSRDALSAFLSPIMQRRLTANASRTRTFARLGCVFVSMVCTVLALMRPQASELTTVSTQDNADVMFVLDVSRSMLAEDTLPNRLTRAKTEITQLVKRLEGYRVGLVAFAGRPVQVCPLTPDHAFFTTVLSTVDTRSAGKGGSRVGDALKGALRGFTTRENARLIVLITDGDDQDLYTEDAAKAVRDAGVKIIAVGLGKEEGSTITLTDPVSHAQTKLLDKDGKPVISKLDGAMLARIATLTEGAYIPVGTSAIDLDAIMASHITPIVDQAKSKGERRIPIEEYAWFLMISLAMLLASLWIGAGAGEPRKREVVP